MGSSTFNPELSVPIEPLDKSVTELRPSSYYENSSQKSNSLPLNRNKIQNDFKADRNPSQLDCLITTVPQNIASQGIAGQHTPTRNSLRHSRMIVLNRTGKVPVKYLPPVIVHYKFIKSLLVFITFLGTVLCTLSVLLLLYSPNIRSRDNTYWSAIPVISSGIIGLLYLCFIPKNHYINRLIFWTNSLKIISTLASLIAVVTSFIICLFAVIHSVSLSTMTCAPPDKVNTSCVCKSNSTTTSTFDQSFHYVDLSCAEVNILYIIVIITSITNIVVTVCEVLYLYLLWCRSLHLYSKISNNNNTDSVNVNNSQ